MKRLVNRNGFSLIELITAMLASTVLIASLAATVALTTQLLDSPPGDPNQWHDRLIADRLASDLRYANGVRDGVADGFEITKPNGNSGLLEKATYQSQTDGMTRQIESGPIMVLDPHAATHEFQVEGYTAPSTASSGLFVRLIGTSRAASPGLTTSLNISTPPGCQAGDLVLLCVSSRSPANLSLSGGGWRTLQSLSTDDMRLNVVCGNYDSSWPNSITVTSTPGAAIAALMLAFENTDPGSPIDWTGSRAGYVWNFWDWSHPSPLETTGFDDRQLNVQVFAAQSDPWYDGTLGMPGFTDAGQVTAAQSNVILRNSLGVVIRNGATPAFSFTPRLLHQVSGYYLQAAVRLEASP